MTIRPVLALGVGAFFLVSSARGQEKGVGEPPSGTESAETPPSKKFAAEKRLSGEITVHPRPPSTRPEPDYEYEALDETKVGNADGTLYRGHSFRTRDRTEVWIVGKDFYVVCTFAFAAKPPYPTLEDVARYERTALPLLRRAGWEGEHLWKMDHGMLRLDKGWGLVINPDLMSDKAWRASLRSAGSK